MSAERRTGIYRGYPMSWIFRMKGPDVNQCGDYDSPAQIVLCSVPFTPTGRSDEPSLYAVIDGGTVCGIL